MMVASPESKRQRDWNLQLPYHFQDSLFWLVRSLEIVGITQVEIHAKRGPQAAAEQTESESCEIFVTVTFREARKRKVVSELVAFSGAEVIDDLPSDLQGSATEDVHSFFWRAPGHVAAAAAAASPPSSPASILCEEFGPRAVRFGAFRKRKKEEGGTQNRIVQVQREAELTAELTELMKIALLWCSQSGHVAGDLHRDRGESSPSSGSGGTSQSPRDQANSHETVK
uniref:Uncharacterized protein n=1 Tax=Chromera velia CCMP2878 TaxID=1169474 RepID=A0A0G4G535_9ALVE|eukprot:Cvel_20328.t1-p1 / transcript=Cvel_20328.t1 / gene=Cvel_20328 / organism=Chromera_velia_CCMP2878 / gene_product=hypothetical protein / transcript_product=hypothetical protein / location=Cvel_scaffold1816:2091-3139(+) / protein_length=226 / sequence_SO=supercontig / SO=protein_coding / is_pseudo=false